jgi:type VI protein secretion system component VasF
MQQSEAAAKKFEETEQRLLEENEALRQANKQLAARLQAAEALEAKRAAETSRWVRIAVKGAFLLVLYFVLAKLLRWLVWRKGGQTSANTEGRS